MLTTLKWLNVRQRFILLKCIMMFNIVNGKTPDYLNDITPVKDKDKDKNFIYCRITHN